MPKKFLKFINPVDFELLKIVPNKICSIFFKIIETYIMLISFNKFTKKIFNCFFILFLMTT